MYDIMYVEQRVALTPTELNILTDADSIRGLIETKLRESYEGRCNSNGYVRPGSIKLLGRSMGCGENGRFTGNIIYDCKISCEVLHPVVGTVFDARVIKVNRMGAYAVFEEAMRILLPRDIHLGDAEFDALEEGATVHVRLERSRFQTNDNFIMGVGRLVPADQTRA